MARLFDAMADETERATWLTGATLTVRTATSPRSARFDWEGGPERVADRDTADVGKSFWAARLDDLKAALEA